MLIIPAIDLEAGSVVRFVQGRKDKKIYSRNPLKTAKHWFKQGAQFLHVVDLDGAITGVQKNISFVKEITDNIDVPVEFGGGVREIKTIEGLLDMGIKRIVLGTKAITDKSFLKKVYSMFKDKVIVSVDAKDNVILIKGWRSPGKGIQLKPFLHFLKETGFKEFIYTDTSKDGTLSGPNIKGIKNLLKESGLKIIASGGISSLEDIYRLKKLQNQGLSGVIIGKALYEGRFTLSEAIKMSQ